MRAQTVKAVADAQRAAIRVAIAGQRHDMAAICREVEAAPSHALLTWALARLPGVMIRALSASTDDGDELDPERVLEQMLDEFPAVIDPEAN